MENNAEIDVTVNTKEKFSRIKTPQFLFQDSFSHLSSSLDTLAKNLKDKGEEHFPLVREMFPEDRKFHSLLTKGVYPYDYITGFE